MRNFFRKLLGKDKKAPFVFTTRHLAEPTGNGERIRRQGGMTPPGLITINDYVQFSSGTNASSGEVWVPTTISADGVKSTGPKADERKEVQPKEVFSQIKTETLENIDFSDLPRKIAAVKERLEILKEHLKEDHLGDEHRTLFYLENRLKYITKTKKTTPFDWGMTTTDAIDDLCKNYKLRVVPLKQYYTLVPKDGLKEMSRYTKAYKTLTGDEPIFELIIKDKQQETRKKDRDPILVANSPFGNFLFVLGAWDEEVEIVDEIIYGAK